jgi:hypothetical protein
VTLRDFGISLRPAARPALGRTIGFLGHLGESLLFLMSAFLCLQPSAAVACAACFGQSDSRLASGMNWGIFTLLGVVVFVLAGFAAFLIFLVRRSSDTTASVDPGSSADTMR